MTTIGEHLVYPKRMVTTPIYVVQNESTYILLMWPMQPLFSTSIPTKHSTSFK